MAQEPFMVADGVYILGGLVRAKVIISHDGVPINTAHPTVTFVRDSDLNALDFDVDNWADATPVELNESRFKAPMVLLGQGVYYYDFDPTEYNVTEEDVYTIIYRNETDPYQTTVQDRVLITPTVAGKVSQGLGFVKRVLNVCLNTSVKIYFKAISGCNEVKISIYDPYGNLLIAGATMQEIGSTGVYYFDFLGRVDGDYLLLGEDGCSGASDAMTLNVGGCCEQLKRIEGLLVAMNITPPSVNPCVNPCRTYR